MIACYTGGVLNKLNIVAHRGYSSEAPENTLAAFLLAINHGFPDIEFDVQLSSYGIPVIIHDLTVDRTTNGHGAVNQHSYDQLKRLDAGSWFSANYTHQQIPSLFEVLTQLHDIANLHIELKSKEAELPKK